MKMISKEDAIKMAKSHKKWLQGSVEGECADFSNSILQSVDFSKMNLNCAIFRGAKLKNCDFSFSKVNHADFSDAMLLSCDFSRAYLVGTNFQNSIIEQASFLFSDLRETCFDNAEMKIVALAWSRLDSKTSFLGIDMTDIDLRMVDIAHATLPEQIIKVGPLENEYDSYIVYFVESDFVQSYLLPLESDAHTLSDFEKVLEKSYEKKNFEKALKKSYKKKDIENYEKSKAEHFATLAMFRALKDYQLAK